MQLFISKGNYRLEQKSAQSLPRDGMFGIHCAVIQPQLDALDSGGGTWCRSRGEDPFGYRMPSVLMRHSSHRSELEESQHSGEIRNKGGEDAGRWEGEKQTASYKAIEEDEKRENKQRWKCGEGTSRMLKDHVLGMNSNVLCFGPINTPCSNPRHVTSHLCVSVPCVWDGDDNTSLPWGAVRSTKMGCLSYAVQCDSYISTNIGSLSH